MKAYYTVVILKNCVKQQCLHRCYIVLQITFMCKYIFHSFILFIHAHIMQYRKRCISQTASLSIATLMKKEENENKRTKKTL